jgi:hypothetical protein
MHTINISLNDEDHRVLSDEYRNMTLEQLRAGAVAESFEQWLAKRLVGHADSPAATAVSATGTDDLCAFNAIEKLITGLKPHGFGLAWLGKYGEELPDSAAELAEALVTGLQLTRSQTRRIQELVEYYAKSAKDVADAARVVVTNRTYGALHEEFRELTERTEKALDHLEPGQALGRVEGAAAMLVGLRVMTRQVAKEKTDAFNQQLHERKK